MIATTNADSGDTSARIVAGGAADLPLFEGAIEDAGVAARGFAITLAASAEQRDAACDLVNRKYGWRGYGSDHQLNDGAGCTTFGAVVGDEMVGTLSLTVDSPARLAADSTFADLLDEVRGAAGTRLCELTKFAMAEKAMPMHVLASLFHTIFIFGTGRYDCTDLLIEVNPRHIRFYEAMLEFERLGGLRVNRSVGAPSQLMRLKVADIGRNIQLYAGSKARSRRSLYPYFLTAAQECLIHERMADLDRRWPFTAMA